MVYGVDASEQQQLLARFEAELEAATDAVQTAIRHRDGLQQVVRGLRAITVGGAEDAESAPPPVIETAPRAPRGRDAVRILLAEVYPRPLHVDELTDTVRARGWMSEIENPRNALNAAAKRLVGDGVAEKGRKPATYRLRDEALPQKIPGADG
jgi:hypothetical protein